MKCQRLAVLAAAVVWATALLVSVRAWPVQSPARGRESRTHGLDDAYAFVSKNSAGCDRRDVALQDVKVRAAPAA